MRGLSAIDLWRRSCAAHSIVSIFALLCTVTRYVVPLWVVGAGEEECRETHHFYGGFGMLAKYKTKQQLAVALGVRSEKYLNYLHLLPSLIKYRRFETGKRSGGYRTISAPERRLKGVQERLASMLGECYRPHPAVHGYVRGRSIKTNAQAHVGQLSILNVDLTNFFGCMHFGRVRGILMSKVYGANKDVATLIAKLCCFDNSLPQGAPTSPILSNMICSAMDTEFERLAKAHQCRYTRYSDDITISSARKEFPSALAMLRRVREQSAIALGADLIATVEKHGFVVNEKKNRLLSKSDRQEVTGLVVNEFVNVPRDYIRNIRAALHAWRTLGLTTATARFIDTSASNMRDEAGFSSNVFGRIQYVGFIRGYQDHIYLKMQRAYHELRLRPENVLSRSQS